MHYRRVLLIAGSDSGAGAGIQADLKTCSALGCFATTAITAITAQNTVKVSAVYPLSELMVESQLEAILCDIGTDSVKIGMLPTAEIARCVQRMLRAHNVTNTVLDPVMVSTSGQRLISEEAVDCLQSGLWQDVRLITPNLPEAELLLGTSLASASDRRPYAKALSQKLSVRRPVSVLLKGGHSNACECTDVLYDAELEQYTEIALPRVESTNTHGTGCTLSSALAAFLAQGCSLAEAFRQSKTFLHEALEAGKDYRLGNGSGPLHPFYKNWE